MGAEAPSGLLGIHTNMAAAIPPEIDKAALTGATLPYDLSAEERESFDRLAFFYKHGLGYAVTSRRGSNLRRSCKTFAPASSGYVDPTKTGRAEMSSSTFTINDGTPCESSVFCALL
jgi:hypothetical protein